MISEFVDISLDLGMAVKILTLQARWLLSVQKFVFAKKYFDRFNPDPGNILLRDVSLKVLPHRLKTANILHDE